MESESRDSNSSPVASTPGPLTSEQRRRTSRTPPPTKFPSTLQTAKMVVVDKNHDLASQVIVSSVTLSSDALDAKQKRRRRSRGSNLRDDDGHCVAKPPCREIGIQVEILPVPKKSPGRFLSFGKRADSSNGIRRDAAMVDQKTPTKNVEQAPADVQPKAPSGPDNINHADGSAESFEKTENVESKKSKKSFKNRDRNIFNRVRKMSQFISALKNSKSSKRRKAEEALAAAAQHHTGHNGRCCQHRSSDAKGDAAFANVTFEERNLKDNASLGLPSMSVKFSKVEHCKANFDPTAFLLI